MGRAAALRRASVLTGCGMQETWVGDAACGRRPDLMTAPFDEACDPVTGQRLEWAAKAVCRACPVIVECRAWALHHEVAGVCGGFTERERDRWRHDVGVEVEPVTTLPFLPIDIACRDLLDAGVAPDDATALVVGRGYSRAAAESIVRRARRARPADASPAEPETDVARRIRDLVDELALRTLEAAS